MFPKYLSVIPQNIHVKIVSITFACEGWPAEEHRVAFGLSVDSFQEL